MNVQIQGTTAPGYEAVREVFARNFTLGDEHRDTGAAVAAYHRGRRVVDLWAGYADRACTRAWQADTLVNLYSATKGLVVIAGTLIYEGGKLRPGDKVTDYWPEFGQNGKEATTVEQMFGHMSGLPGFREKMTLADVYDWDKACSALARQKPSWKPGTQISYQALTWGFQVGQLIRRASGQTVADFVQQRLAGPLEADFFVGVPQTHRERVADTLGPRNPKRFPPTWLFPLLGAVMPQYMGLCNPLVPPETANDEGWRKAELPAANGHASARAIARIYGALACGGAEECPTLRFPPVDVVRNFVHDQAPRLDLFSHLRGTRAGAFGIVGRDRGGNATTIGHYGWGGCLGAANLDAGLSVGYVCNQMCRDLNKDPRGKDLCAAIHAAAGVDFVAA